MKKKHPLYRLFQFLLITQVLVACVDPLQSPEGDQYIELTLANLAPVVQTRADDSTIAGEDAYNENLVRSVDCFFFPSDATGSTPSVYHALGRSAQAEDGHYTVRVFYTDDDAQNMFGSTESGSCLVYVICNSPLIYGQNPSVDDLKELIVESDFSAQVRQSSFLMPAEAPAVVTLTTDNAGKRTASGSLYVKRSAAKMQVYLSVANTVVDELHQEWHRAQGSRMEIRLANLVKRGKVDGTYAVQDADHVTTRYRQFESLTQGQLVEGKADYTYSHAPFYSYPVSWPEVDNYTPVIEIRIPWMIDNNVEWRNYQIRPNVGDAKLEANHYYRTFVKINSLGAEDEEDPVWIPEANYMILDWMEESAGGQGTVPSPLTRYNYLVVDEPDVTINNEVTATFDYISSSRLASITFTSAKYYNNMLANPEVTYLFGNDGVKTTATGSVSVNGQTFSYDMSQPGVLTVTHSLQDVYSSWEIHATLTNADGNQEDITIVQNPSISLIRKTFAGDVFVNGYFGRVRNATYATSYYPYPRYESGYLRIKGNGSNYTYYRINDNGSLTQANNPYFNGGSWINAGQLTNGQTYQQYFYTDNSASNLFYHCTALWGDDTTQQVADSYDANTQSGTYGSVLGSIKSLNETIDRSFYTTAISVSSFNSANNTYVANGEPIEYRIGDPRVPASTHYSGANSWETVTNFYKYLYYDNSTESFAAWSDPGNILIVSQAVNDRNIIAPSFLVSSALNANLGLTFDNAVKRGATYQEAGFPAGRWRLPSEAEIAFIVTMQRDGVIPNLYATEDYFWAGSGRLVFVPASSSTPISFYTKSEVDSRVGSVKNYSCRYVYDLWYWGDTPAATNVYHPNGHNTAY